MTKRAYGKGDTGTSNPARRQPARVKKQKYNTIFEEVEKFENLGARMHELLLTEPEGTRIYLRVRDHRTIN